MNSVIRAAVEEDLGPALRDISSEALHERASLPATGKVKVKSDGVICGLRLIEPILATIEEMMRMSQGFSDSIKIALHRSEGDQVSAGTIVATLDGPAGKLLSAERTVLNFLQRLSGVATLTRECVSLVNNSRCKLLDTRKTTPGMRALEKYAVRIGGGTNHRFGLYDMIMLKDNHIAAWGGDIAAAVAAARQVSGTSARIEVETSDIEQVRQSLAAGADIIMLDNMTLLQMRECVQLVGGRVPVEASGGITMENLSEVADTGVDYISMGAITHSAKALDISMKITLGNQPL